jgi:hypothetical protein
MRQPVPASNRRRRVTRPVLDSSRGSRIHREVGRVEGWRRDAGVGRSRGGPRKATESRQVLPVNGPLRLKLGRS